MPLAAYPDLGLFVRATRILPIVAIAAFAGGVVGGFVVFAINGALAPPRSDLGTNLSATGHATATAVPAKPATIGGAPTTNPAGTQPPAAVAPPQNPIQAPASAMSVAATAQTTVQDAPRPTRWPNALMRGRKVITPLRPLRLRPVTKRKRARRQSTRVQGHRRRRMRITPLRGGMHMPRKNAIDNFHRPRSRVRGAIASIAASTITTTPAIGMPEPLRHLPTVCTAA
jgi:hypothetical protein